MAPHLKATAMTVLLHLTDLHFGYEGDKPAAAAQRTLCLTALLREIDTLAPEWRPAFICISGDLVWRALAADYAALKTWLDALLACCGLGYQQVIACVGNHEVNRALAKTVPRPASAAAADQALIVPMAAHYLAPFATFTDFCRSNGIAALQLGQDASHLAGQVMLGGMRFVVLNSAWCSQDDKDKDTLWLGLPQLQVMAAQGQLPLLEQDASAPFTIALMHHPFDWLHADDHNASPGRPNPKDYLALRCHILLTGHTHGEVRDPDQITRGAWHFTGGASYAGADYENSFRLIRLEAGQLAYRSFKFDPRSAKHAWRAHALQTLPLAAAKASTPAKATPHGMGKLGPRARNSDLIDRIALTDIIDIIDISRIDQYVPTQLIGRESETALLAGAWDLALQNATQRPRILSFVALGGAGKTSLVAKWAASLAANDWPGCDAVFAWSFYSQGSTDQVAASADLFINAALIRFGDAAIASSNSSGHDKGQRLAELVGQQRTLLLLDGLEPLQYPPTSSMQGELKDQAMLALLKGLAARNAGLCVLTTRSAIADLNCYNGSTAQEHYLTRLSAPAGVALLRACGVRGTQDEFDAVVEQIQGHALSLQLLGSYLRDAHGGDIRQRHLVTLAVADGRHHAFHVMDAYVRWFAGDGVAGRRALALLRLMGLFDRPAAGDCVAALLQTPPIPGLTDELLVASEAQRNITQSRLEEAKLLTVQIDEAGELVALTAHPLVREYFAAELQTKQAPAWQAAHQRLFEHLCQTTGDKKAKPTLEDLQPLYQAVAHGCLAGLYERARKDVYRDRIFRGHACYSTDILGAYSYDLGVLACFFKHPWDIPAIGLPETEQAWLRAQAGYCLRAMGQLPNAHKLMLAALAMFVKLQEREKSAVAANNVSELELVLGKFDEAFKHIDDAVEYAKSSGEIVQQMITRANRAYALHQVQNQPQAQAEWNEIINGLPRNAHDVLPCLPCFQYSELQMEAVERGAWKRYLRHTIFQTIPVQPVCDAVTARAAQALSQANDVMLDIGLAYLTLGRAALYTALLAAGPLPPCQDHLQHAVDGLRRSRDSDHLPRALLTRAWLRAHNGTLTGPASAQADLDEAWQIAARGPMPLHMADIHLTRARLFARLASAAHAYPPTWHSPAHDLREARRLIEKHGYWRRKEELEDAEAAILPPHRTT